MAAQVFAETPSRLLRRVQLLEDMEMPSLPSIHHDMGYESSLTSSDNDSLVHVQQHTEASHDVETPHPHRLAPAQAQSKVPSETSSTSAGSPYPPTHAGALVGTPSSRDSSKVLTSTPSTQHHYHSHSQSTRIRGDDTRSTVTAKHERTRSGTTGLGNSTRTGRENWHTPRESSSFSADESLIEDHDAEIATNGQSSDTSFSSQQSDMVNIIDTPLTRRISASHVVFNRPRRRGLSSQQTEHGMEATSSLPPLEEVSSPGSSIGMALTIPDEKERVPSLSRSELSGADTDGEARTPEGPTRAVIIATPRSNHGGQPDDNGVDVEHDPLGGYGSPNIYHDLASTVLQDVTVSLQNVKTPTPQTPSPYAHSLHSDMSTPRAPLNDAERRKSHVLAVLSSSQLPTRTWRAPVRGTPHPLRRVSMPPSSTSIMEEGHEPSVRQSRFTIQPGGRSNLSVGATSAQNESFISIASSADLTSDKRGTTVHHTHSRINTSFPTILLPTGAQSNGPLRAVSDQRADGIKIHKHLNAMNKQLLETNSDLAREAEAWRDEAERLRAVLEEAGVEFEDIDVMANISGVQRSLSFTNSSVKYDEGESSARVLRNGSSDVDAFVTHQQNKDANERSGAVDELVERLEELEGVIDNKNRMIADLEHVLETARVSTDDGSIAHSQLRDLELQLEESERCKMQIQADFASQTGEHARKFAEICSGFEEQVTELEMRLASARSEADRVKAEKERLQAMAENENTTDREKELRLQVAQLEREVSKANEAAGNHEVEAQRYREEKARAVEELDSLRSQDQELRAKVRRLEADLNDAVTLSDEAVNDLEVAQQAQASAEGALAEARLRIDALESEADQHQATISDQETELDRQHEELQSLLNRIEELEQGQSTGMSEKEAADVDRLQAMVEKLNYSLEQRDVEIELLRGQLEKVDKSVVPVDEEQRSYVAAIEERLDDAYREIGRLKHELSASPHRKSAVEIRDARIRALEQEKATLQQRLATSKTTASIASSSMQMAGSPFTRPTPFVHKAISSIKGLKTPGSIQEMSWLQTTIGNPDESVLHAQLEHLQTQLNDANEQLDQNFSRLEEAGIGAIGLAEELAAARDHIGQLEDEIRTLLQRNKASLALVNAQREEISRESDVKLQKALGVVHDQLEHLKADETAERGRLHRENSQLQDLLRDLRMKSQKEATSFHSELQIIEAAAQAEITKVKKAMTTIVGQRDDLQKELRATSTKVIRLERDLASQREEYERLIERQTTLAGDTTQLVRARATIKSIELSLRETNARSDSLTGQLDESRRRLSDAQEKIRELERERATVIQDLAVFESDLERQHVENANFSAALRMFKEQQATMLLQESDLGKLREELRAAQHKLQSSMVQLDEAKQKMTELEELRDIQLNATSRNALEEQRSRFKAQAKDLAVQIRYLKVKFTREASFRNALALQKRYLLLLVGGMSLNEQATLKAIASMGFPSPQPPTQKRTFKAVALAVMSVIRTRNAAQQWRAERELKSDAVMNHERRRVSSR
ncbi:hypothetical protein TREMEDRAFT_69871 [Tremella mesenterica DSM 1558]|uniref:uncharacterized protein n=1 Tax=Tremella mesenterica (strain ATCC 24925 / CBS 8224 / DSM 1558 / NBRC 9311 / NRRL Y-6157 / RJB 2259-6 / UBC 559-6) TaxID=578456 RepID=UPI0003F4922B|nr:uncharacterized protein TREMEDRAFT_69871 [Tremella mesenterica DSM 1558]EIW66869.1 hypothetical protein TREMEDRAFT_69871 [Tremella mesenterica DSM 1558]